MIFNEVAPDPDNDPQHPIPNLNVIDVMSVRKSGGAKMRIIIASPLQSDRRSFTRLMDKIEVYLKYLYSEEFRSEAGIPTPENTTISVTLHPDSVPEIYDFIERAKPWAFSHNATLIIEHLDLYGH